MRLLADFQNLSKQCPRIYRLGKPHGAFHCRVNTTRGTDVASTPHGTPLDHIPDPEEVRTRLVACTREASMLRSLLRLAERLKRQRETSGAVRREVQHV